MELIKAKLLVAQCFSDPEISALYAAGDKLSRHQTKHDIDHAEQVRDLAVRISSGLNGRKPGFLDEWTTDVVVPLAAYLHDIGRAIDVDEHAKAGAKWTRDYLRRLRLPGDTETLPTPVINRIARIVACHRSQIVLKMPFDDAAWAIVVLADKCVGDEERVRPVRAAVLSVLRFFRATWIPLRKGGVHDRANFAIKKADVVFRNKPAPANNLKLGDICLDLTIDKRVCDGSLIMGLYSDRFQACVKAADYLGYDFRLVFNGETFAFQNAEWRSAS
jgi:hypothetical protein